MRRLARHLFTPPSTAAGYIEQLADGVKRRWRTSWPLSPMPKLADKVGADVALHLIHRARACCDRRSLAIALLVGGVMGTGVGPCMWFLPPGRHDLRAVCLMVLVVLPFVLWSTCRRLRTRRRLRELLLECGHCPSCGHDLRASPGRCPECGAAAASATKV